MEKAYKQAWQLFVSFELHKAGSVGDRVCDKRAQDPADDPTVAHTGAYRRSEAGLVRASGRTRYQDRHLVGHRYHVRLTHSMFARTVRDVL